MRKELAMAWHPLLLLYVLLEQGSLQSGTGLLFQPLCADGVLAPPLIDEVRNSHVASSFEGSVREYRPGETWLLQVQEESGRYELYLPEPAFITDHWQTESCFGFAPGRIRHDSG